MFPYLSIFVVQVPVSSPENVPVQDPWYSSYGLSFLQDPNINVAITRAGKINFLMVTKLFV